MALGGVWREQNTPFFVFLKSQFVLSEGMVAQL